MISPLLVTELDDRWVVKARSSVVTDLAASPNALRIEFDSGLSVEVAGPWRAAAGSPITGKELGLDNLGDQIGSHALSFVLFSTGSVRIVLSTGTTIVAMAGVSTHVVASLPGTFTWEARAGTVSHWYAEAGDDG